MHPKLKKLEDELQAALELRKQSTRKAAKAREKIADLQRREDSGLAYDIGRACLASPSDPTVLALLEWVSPKLKEHRTQMLQEVVAHAKRKPSSKIN